jgi:hypothetical protein
MPPAPGCDTLGCDACLAALHNTFATFTMRRRITPHISRVAEPDDQPLEYGLRKRTAHQTVSDDKSHEDAPRHRSPPKRLKRTPASSSAHSPSSRGPAKKRTKEGLGRRGTRKDKGKEWSAEAILEESDSQYLIKYEPVEEGAQYEISWQLKYYANAALIAWWEERKMKMALGNGNAERDNVPDLPSEDDEASEHYNPVENHGRPEKSVSGLLSQEQHEGKSEDTKQHKVGLVDKSAFQSNEEPVENTLLKASTANVPETSNVPVPEINAAVARMYDHHKPGELHDSPPLASNDPGKVSASPRFRVSAYLPAAVEDTHRCDKSQPRSDMVPDGESSKSESRSPIAASTRGQHFATSASSQQLRMVGGEKSVSVPVTDGTKELVASLVTAATAYVLQDRDNHTSVQAAYGMHINNHGRPEGSKHDSKGHVTDWGGQGRSSPRPGTSISTVLSPAPSTLSNNNNKDSESMTSTRNDGGETSPRTLAHVEVSNDKDPSVSGAPLGRLASARKQLRSLLIKPGKRRYHESRALFPPSP